MADPAPMRTCIGCTQTDDHPRHIVWMPGDVETTWHMDCHVLATGCDVCERQLADAGGATGDALRAHLNTKDG